MSKRGASLSYDSPYQDMSGWTEEETDNYFYKEFDRWRSSLTASEADAVETYTGSMYDAINQYLRSGTFEDGTSDIQKQRIISWAKEAERGLSKFKLDKNIYVYRGSNTKLLRGLGIDSMNMSNAEMAKQLNDMKGSIVTDKGLMSTSSNGSYSSNPIQYRIKVPKGTSGAWVNPMSRFQGEREFLLNTGASFRVLGARVDGYKLRVDLEIYRERGRQVRHVGTRSTKS